MWKMVEFTFSTLMSRTLSGIEITSWTGEVARPHTSYAFDFLYSSKASKNRSLSCRDK